MYLALEPDRRITIKRIAESYGISRNHLMKVVNLLAQAGIIHASRGPNGGIKLARPADRIMVGEIVRLTEDSFRIVECFGPDNQCTITPACGLKGIFKESLTAFFAVLDKYSIQELIKQEVELRKLLVVHDSV